LYRLLKPGSKFHSVMPVGKVLPKYCCSSARTLEMSAAYAVGVSVRQACLVAAEPQG
jgi:hypothetical protein